MTRGCATGGTPAQLFKSRSLSSQKRYGVKVVELTYDPNDPTTWKYDSPAVASGPVESRRQPKYIRRVWLSWVGAAAVLPGKALAVGLRVWFEVGCRRAERKGKFEPVPLNLSTTGLPRRTAQRALQTLAKAGLVSVEHRDGRPPLVTLIVEDDHANPV